MTLGIDNSVGDLRRDAPFPDIAGRKPQLVCRSVGHCLTLKQGQGIRRLVAAGSPRAKLGAVTFLHTRSKLVPTPLIMVVARSRMVVVEMSMHVSQGAMIGAML